MRTTQEMGLPNEAHIFLADNRIRRVKCSHCNQYPPVTDKKQHDFYRGLHEEEVPLYQYKLLNGQLAFEFLQTTIWSNGPMFFLGLRTEYKEFTWSKEKLDKV